MTFRYWKFCGMLVAFVLLAVGAVFAEPDVNASAIAQVPTETPAVINIAPADQGQGDAQGAPTPTRTPTPEGGAFLEAKEYANVRSEPSTDSAQLGTINAGESYNVLGRYASWIQFEYQSSPTGRGWVYGELVNLSGNTDSIPDIDPYAADQQLSGAAVGATSTQSILTLTPGGVLTATEISRQGVLPGTGATPTPAGTREILPTYTYPPGIVAVAPTSGAALTGQATDPADVSTTAVPTNTSDSLPPIAPILILGGIGLLGLAISALRRG